MEYFSMKQFLLLTAFSLILSASNDMESLYLKNGCNSCHGMYGEGMGASPRLQGQSESVLLRRLKDLKKGKTRTAFGSIMISFAKALDEDEIVDMAKYLARLETTVNKDRYDIEFDAAGDGGS
jgi:cytochrome c553